MIQRIQSLFLLLASVCFWVLFKLPFATSSAVASPIFEDKVFNINDNTILLVLAILGGVLTLANIFLFNNRPLQMRLNYLNVIFALFLGTVAFWLVFSNGQEIGNAVEISDGMGLYFPIGALIFVILSNVFIKKDNKLVKSMDRLR